MVRININKIAQVIFEFAIVLALVALALVMMQLYLKRGIQAGIKIAADELGLQQDSVELDAESGEVSESFMRVDTGSTRSIAQALGGQHTLTLIETSEILYGVNTFWSDFTTEEPED